MTATKLEDQINTYSSPLSSVDKILFVGISLLSQTKISSVRSWCGSRFPKSLQTPSAVSLLLPSARKTSFSLPLSSLYLRASSETGDSITITKDAKGIRLQTSAVIFHVNVALKTCESNMPVATKTEVLPKNLPLKTGSVYSAMSIPNAAALKPRDIP